MDFLYYSPLDIAVIICSMDEGCKRENEIISFIWENEQKFILKEYHNNKRKFILDIYYWMNYFRNKQTIDSEFPAIGKDLLVIDTEFSNSNYISDYSNLDLFFKNLRLRIRLNNEKDYIRTKLRTLLKQYGYKRRSAHLVEHIKTSIHFYGLKTYLRGGVECDIENIGIDEMITFRLSEGTLPFDNTEEIKEEIHDLDHLLDKVRTKYYHSSNLRRPTISWTDDYPTAYYGKYDFYNNHITISRILNDKRITEEMISMVIYHESLHQDFGDHDSRFVEKMSMFPDYEKLDKKLSDFASETHEEMQYPENFNSFTTGKKKIVYINLPYYDDYENAFVLRDQKVLIDFNAKINFELPDNQEDMMIVLFVKVNEDYHIVGWCTNGKLLSKPKVDNFSCFGDFDISYQYITDYKDTYIIPISCCSYRISSCYLPKEFKENDCCCFSIEDEEIQPEIQYINSYCEGYFRLGYDSIDSIPKFENISIKTLKSISEPHGRDVWLANAIYEREPTIENLINRAKTRKQNWWLTASLEDYLNAIKQNYMNVSCVTEIIKLCVILDRFDEAVDFYLRYKDRLPKSDEHLNNCIAVITDML